MKTVAIIQARMGSTRLPGKVMKSLCGKTVLEHVVTRVKACALVDEIVVATTVEARDEIIVAETGRLGARSFRGSEEDVLSRYYLAAQEASADIVVRVTSDCPLLDPHILESMLRRFHTARATGVNIDYLSNTLERTFPRGLDVEIFPFASLERAYREADHPYQREHVTPYIYQHPELFSLENLSNKDDLSHHRWTLDTPEDWQLIEEIYGALYREGTLFTSEAILDLLESRPELVAINAQFEEKT